MLVVFLWMIIVRIERLSIMSVIENNTEKGLLIKSQVDINENRKTNNNVRNQTHSHSLLYISVYQVNFRQADRDKNR